MPGRYTAQSQSMWGAVGAPMPPRQGVDVAGALDALTSGATSLIHQQMLRRQAENEMAVRNQQLALEQQREARESSQAAQEFGLRQESERHRFIEAGGIPAHTSTEAVGSSTPITPVNPQPTPSPVRSAMTAGASDAAMPGPQLTPGGSGVPVPPEQSATVYHPENVTTPESFDATRGAPYTRMIGVQELRNTGAVQRVDEKATKDDQRSAAHDARVADMRKSAEANAKAIAAMRTAASSAKTGTQKAMTANQAEQGRVKAAEDLIDKAGGSFDEASDMLQNTAQGKMLRDQGVTPYHLAQARTSWMRQNVATAGRLQAGAMGMSPEESVDAVKTTRKLVGGGTAQSSTGDTDSAQPTSAAPAKPATPAAKPAAPTSTAKPTKKAAPANDFSDDEIAEAMKKGAKTPEDVRAFVTKKRGGKK